VPNSVCSATFSERASWETSRKRRRDDPRTKPRKAVKLSHTEPRHGHRSSQSIHKPKKSQRILVQPTSASACQGPRPETPPQLSVEDSFAKIRELVELTRSPITEQETETEREDGFAKIRELIELAHSPSPEPEVESESSFAFAETLDIPCSAPRLEQGTPLNSLFDRWEGLEGLVREDSPPVLPSRTVDPRVIFGETDAIPEYESTWETGNSLDFTLDEDAPFQHIELDDEPAEIVDDENTQNDAAGDNNEPEPQLDSENENHNNEAAESHNDNGSTLLEQPQLASEKPEAVYVPERIVAQRESPSGLEYLIEWEDYPEEKDWTWEPEQSISSDAADLVGAWKAKQSQQEAAQVAAQATLESGLEAEIVEQEEGEVAYIVEKILGKRKFQGVPHYLVKWKGYEKVEDRTWEPCERLRIDVPGIVAEFEENKGRKGSK